MPISRPDPEAFRALGESLGMQLEGPDFEEWLELCSGFLGALQFVEAWPEPDRGPPPPRRFEKPSRAANPLGAWVAQTRIQESQTGPLAGRTVVLKDNIALAGVPMAGGASFLEGFVPDQDATVVRRVLDAGAVVLGKAACEYLSGSGGSHTSCTGVVRNPHDLSRTSGGSSSGCGALVGAGEVELAIGGDQGGSIRFPASYCGIVGLKPTHGLVPYTGILSIDANLDHAGPMTANLADNALLLEVLAGSDGQDPRQLELRKTPYVEALGAGVSGLRVGILEDGFGLPGAEAEVDAAVRAAAAGLASQGAKVQSVRLQEHAAYGALVVPFLVIGGVEAIRGGGFQTHAGGVVPFGLPEAFARFEERADELPPNMKVMVLAAAHAESQGARRVYAKALRLRAVARAAYDALLSRVDLLLMPTTPRVAPPLPDESAPLSEQIAHTAAGIGNTVQFDVTGHPAISVPCGTNDAGLPIGCQLVGRRFDEATLYRAAAPLEDSC